MVKKNFGLYDQSSGATTQFVEFPDRTHWIIAEKGYQEVADYVMNWIDIQIPESRAMSANNG